MIVEPERLIEDFIAAGADAVTVHFEACPHLHRTLQQIKKGGIRAGVALNPATPVSSLVSILGEIDLVLIMSVNPGFGGQSFIPHSLEKIRELRRMIDERGVSVAIQVDGGVRPDTIGALRAAGVDQFVAGSAIFAQPDYRAAMTALRRAL